MYFKIIYIAPMKALATEMTNGFGIRLEKLGLKVRELTGDTTLSRRQIAETQVTLCINNITLPTNKQFPFCEKF